MITAMILAAGIGSRLQPLTKYIAKPLLCIQNKPLIAYHLEALVKCGIEKVVINLYHLSDQIRNHLGDGSQFGLQIIYSEENFLLGTAGGVRYALTHLGSDPFLLISADIFTDFPLAELKGKLQKYNSLAHLVMVENPNWHPKGDFCLAQDHYLYQQSTTVAVSGVDWRRYTYANIGIFDPKLFTNLPVHLPFALGDLMRATLIATPKKISAEVYRHLWVNVGTHKTYLEAQQKADTLL